jgi:hypothetical protein
VAHIVYSASDAITRILKSGGDYTRPQAERMIADADGPDEMSTPLWSGAVYVMRVTNGKYNVLRDRKGTSQDA